MEKRILLVEDDARSREAFARALGRALAAEGLDVAFVGAGSVAEARARLQEGGLDAALIDVTLPDGDGLDLAREIAAGGGPAGAPIPTIVRTANLSTTVAARAMEAGARGAHSKAVSVPEAVETIKRLTDAVARGPNKFVLYRHLTPEGPEYRWRLAAPGGRTLARAASGHREKADCERDMRLAMESHPESLLRDLTAAGSDKSGPGGPMGA